MRRWRILLILVAVICIGIALYYPITYRMAEESNNSELDELAAMRQRALEQIEAEENGTTTASPPPQEVSDAEPAPPAEVTETSSPVETPLAAPEETETPSETVVPEGTAAPQQTEAAPTETSMAEATTVPAAQATEAIQSTAEPEASPAAVASTATASSDMGTKPPATTAPPTPTPTPDLSYFWLDDSTLSPWTPRPTPTPTPSPSPTPSPTPDRTVRKGARAYTAKDKVELSEDDILPELKEIYALNHDLIGWLVIPGTNVDYPVVQSEDNEYYLHRDFYGADNNNGQIILDNKCDPYTPSYNLVISGHHMNNGSMFGSITKYSDESYWKQRKFVEFDTLVERKQYVIFAAFYSADYDEYEDGFRYYADIRYKIDADMWFEEIEQYKLYDTGIDVEFGDEFLTLTTCSRTFRRDGRFVLVCRKIREGEKIK